MLWPANYRIFDKRRDARGFYGAPGRLPNGGACASKRSMPEGQAPKCAMGTAKRFLEAKKRGTALLLFWRFRLPPCAAAIRWTSSQHQDMRLAGCRTTCATWRSRWNPTGKGAHHGRRPKGSGHSRFALRSPLEHSWGGARHCAVPLSAFAEQSHLCDPAGRSVWPEIRGLGRARRSVRGG